MKTYFQRLQSDKRIHVAWIVLGTAFILGCFNIFWGEFVDEADNLVNGLFVSRGFILYKDLFAHHFPFPYYWVSGIVTVFGRSIFIVRLTVWLFQIVTFGILIKISDTPLAFSFLALIWSILRILYYGTMTIYPVFSSTALIAIFGLVMTIIQQNRAFDWRYSLLLGLYFLIALASDPLTIYPITVSLLVLLVCGRKHFYLSVSVLVLGMVLYSSYLFATGSFSDFWRNAIFFNSNIYASYSFTSPVRFKSLLLIALKGLEITDSSILNLDPFKSLTFDSVVNGWLFTGFLYRVAVILLSIFFVMQKKYVSTIFLYFFVAASLVIDKWGFRSQPFVLISLFSASLLISGEWQREKQNISKYKFFFQKISVATIAILLVWLLLRTSLFTVENRHQLSYRSYFGYYENTARKLQKRICNQPDIVLGYYPAGSYHNWFANMAPIAGYSYLWPWVAEVGQDVIIDSLRHDNPLAIVVIQDVVIWNQYDTKEYLSPLIHFLEQNYIQSSDLSSLLPNSDYSIYISPGLYNLCYSNNGDL